MPADDVLGGACAELRARALAAPGWPERFAVLDEILLRLVSAGARPNLAPEAAPEVGWAWRQLLASGGTLRIGDLAEQTGWSARHLTGRFRTEIGLTPKAAARVVRFTRARDLLIRLRGPGRAGRPGRAVRLPRPAPPGPGSVLAGCPPSQWAAEEFRNVQAGAWLAEGS